MAKNSFKREINERYKGRGNAWVKVGFDSEAFSYVKNLYNKVSDSEKAEYIIHTEREGFSWIRFKKVVGNEDSPMVLFEVRLKGSKIDQPEYSITIPDMYVKELSLLGNTPLKLQLESKIKKTSSTKNITKEVKTFSRKEDDLINVAK